MKIKAIYVKSTKEILFSRTKHDMRASEDNSVYIDGGLDYIKVTGNIDNIVFLELDGDFLLKSILNMDYKYTNKLAELYPDGYHGRFKIDNLRNIKYYSNLILNFESVKDELFSNE
jgi:hypothetical protein